MAGRGGEDFAPHLPLAHVVGRGVDADEDLRAGLGQLGDRIALVEAALPILLVIPGVLADG